MSTLGVARRFVGKKALVTGAATGIGKAIACRLAGEGAAVAINFLGTPAEAERALEEVRAAGGEANVDPGLHMTVEADVADARFVFSHKMGATDHICGKYGGEPAFHALSPSHRRLTTANRRIYAD